MFKGIYIHETTREEETQNKVKKNNLKVFKVDTF